MKIKFWKMSSAGNDFILISGIKASAQKKASIAEKLCRRKISVGADGLVIVGKRGSGAVTMEYFNSDGSAAFCGNGARCAVIWARENGLFRGGKVELHTANGILPAEVTRKNSVKIKMPSPRRIKLYMKSKFPVWVRELHFLDIGVPHAVVPVKGLDSMNVFSMGRELRFHKAFGKNGTNVNFIELKNGILKVRTYERGVENETLACGTGITASAVTTVFLGMVKSPVVVISRSGKRFKIWLEQSGEVFIEGPAEMVFSGEVDI